jgi:hypothetical protein
VQDAIPLPGFLDGLQPTVQVARGSDLPGLPLLTPLLEQDSSLTRILAAADALVADAADAILTDDRRPGFVAACGLCATTLRWHGRPLESTRVLEAAAAAQAGVPGREVWPVLNTARLAVAATASRLMQPEGAEAE